MIFTNKGKLVILGSDKRGTIYGIYELSRQIGVSPWYWMADAPIQKHEQIFAKSGIYLSDSRQHMRSEVFDNLRWLSIDFNISTAGYHTVQVVMIDPEIVVEKLVINPDNEHPSYHGKE